VSGEVSDELTRALRRMVSDYAPDGKYERSQRWLCEDGWVVEYTTTRVVGGPHDGKYVVVEFRPYGKGSRGGRKTARQWKRAYWRGFAKRKDARARAETLYWRHSPSRAARHGIEV
jgi:hypothetical protein